LVTFGEHVGGSVIAARRACPKTNVVALRPATEAERPRVGWINRTPNGEPVEPGLHHGVEVRQRYGVRREFDAGGVLDRTGRPQRRTAVPSP
jgi:hypothetical protein